jgi:hypothetical protein
MSKSRRASSPGSIVPGIGCTDQEEARNERRPFNQGRVRRCEGHICVDPEAVNRVFCTYFATGLRLARETVRFPRLSVDKDENRHFKASKLLFLKSFRRGTLSGLDILPHRVCLGFDLFHSVLHQVADGDDSTNPAAVDDRQMTDSPLRHQRQS